MKAIVGIILAGLIASCLLVYDQTGNNQQQPPVTADVETTTPVEPSFILDELLTINSEAELKKKFGEENVKHSKGYYPEGLGEYENSLLYPGTANEVEFVWQDDTLTFSGLAEIAIYKKGTDWKTTDDITIGTDLKELEKLNQSPFEFGGFGWDYAGWTDWKGGYLSTKKVYITLEYPPNIEEDKYPDLWGDTEISSDSEIAQQANPVVYKVRLSLQ